MPEGRVLDSRCTECGDVGDGRFCGRCGALKPNAHDDSDGVAPVQPTRSRRARPLLAGLVVLMLAAGGVYASTRAGQSSMPTAPTEVATPSAATTPPAGSITSTHVGILPDGTPFTLQARGVQLTDPAPSGVVMYASQPDRWRALGVITFNPVPEATSADVALEAGHLRIPTGSWVIDIEVYPDLLADWTDDDRRELLDSVRAKGEGGGLPWMRLGGRLRFADDHDVPSQLQVEFHSAGIAVRRGCPEADALACDPDVGNVHVAVTDAARSWNSGDLSVTSP